MLKVLVIRRDGCKATAAATALRAAGHTVLIALSPSGSLSLLLNGTLDFVVLDSRFGEALGAGALGEQGRHRTIAGPANVRPLEAEPLKQAADSDGAQACAAARWARALIPIIDAPSDPKTIAKWSRWIAASPGAVRNWCCTAGIPARRSLVFGRMLRAVSLSDGGRRRPENLLDVVDQRTLTGLLRYAGLGNAREFPHTLESFFARQILVLDPETMAEVKRALKEYLGRAGRQIQFG